MARIDIDGGTGSRHVSDWSDDELAAEGLTRIPVDNDGLFLRFGDTVAVIADEPHVPGALEEHVEARVSYKDVMVVTAIGADGTVGLNAIADPEAPTRFADAASVRHVNEQALSYGARICAWADGFERGDARIEDLLEIASELDEAAQGAGIGE